MVVATPHLGNNALRCVYKFKPRAVTSLLHSMTKSRWLLTSYRVDPCSSNSGGMVTSNRPLLLSAGITSSVSRTLPVPYCSRRLQRSKNHQNMLQSCRSLLHSAQWFPWCSAGSYLPPSYFMAMFTSVSSSSSVEAKNIPPPTTPTVNNILPQKGWGRTCLIK